jgi:hypothetical protein
VEDGLEPDQGRHQNTACIEYESEGKMNDAIFSMITIVNCNTCMRAIIILDSRISPDQMVSAMKYGCVPVYMSSTCLRCSNKLLAAEEFTIPSGFPIALSMVQSSTTFNRFISAYGVWPMIAGTSFHRVMHPLDLVNAIPDNCTILSVIQKGLMDMDVIKCEMDEFF